ncbi:hypothetical protein [Chlorogloeopsis sp. ULAP02]|uniref:hypothetical protein n=1 Tax=Chlorogloeopsis sp. ULAP02 TaxID=3107926 RepID=UPI003134F6B1
MQQNLCKYLVQRCIKVVYNFTISYFSGILNNTGSRRDPVLFQDTIRQWYITTGFLYCMAGDRLIFHRLFSSYNEKVALLCVE